MVWPWLEIPARAAQGARVVMSMRQSQGPVYSLAAKFSDQDQAKRVYTDLERALKALRFDAHVSRIVIADEMYVSFLHEGPESSIPASVMQAVREHMNQGQGIGPLPQDAIANIQARRQARRAQGVGQYESHEPTPSTYRYPALRDAETKEILAELYDQGELVGEQPYTGPGPAPGSPVYPVNLEDLPAETRAQVEEELKRRNMQVRSTQARQIAHAPTPAAAPLQGRRSAPGKAGKPLLERYLTYLRLAQENARARLHDKTGLTRDQYNFNLLLMTSYHDTYSRMAGKALKYRLAASAQNMVDALRPRPLLLEDMSLEIMANIGSHRRELDPDIATPILTLPAAPIWLEFEEPVMAANGDIAGIFFTCADREVEQMLTEERREAMRKVLETSVKRPDQSYSWSLNFISSDGTPSTRYSYEEKARAWWIVPATANNDEGRCPTEECQEQPRGDGTFDIIPCAFCGTILAYWRSWMVTALLTVQGDLAATETAEWPRHQEQTTRKVKRPNSPKYDEIKVTHDYYLVSFDASVKRVTPEPEEAHEVTPRGSWVAAAQEIDPASVVYVRHDFGKTQRRLDPERNPYWKTKRTVEVRPFSKRIPMRVDHLQHRITRVIASRFEQSENQ